MMPIRTSTFLAASFLAAVGQVSAHHSMAAVFDFNLRVSLTGTLTSVDWRNPHIYLFIDVRNDDGQIEQWALEGPSPVVFRILDNAGRDDFDSAVDRAVKVDASRARDGSMTALIRTIEFPDGKQVTLCPNNC